MWLDPDRKPHEVWYAHTQGPPFPVEDISSEGDGQQALVEPVCMPSTSRYGRQAMVAMGANSPEEAILQSLERDAQEEAERTHRRTVDKAKGDRKET